MKSKSSKHDAGPLKNSSRRQNSERSCQVLPATKAARPTHRKRPPTPRLPRSAAHTPPLERERARRHNWCTRPCPAPIAGCLVAAAATLPFVAAQCTSPKLSAARLAANLFSRQLMHVLNTVLSELHTEESRGPATLASTITITNVYARLACSSLRKKKASVGLRAASE